MGLRDLTSIDIILERPPFETELCKLILIVVDATSDLSDQERYKLLVQKLTAYLAYVDNPQFAISHPKTKPADVIIRVLTVMPPTIDMQLLNAIKSKDSSIRLRVFISDYHAYMVKVKSIKPARPSLN